MKANILMLMEILSRHTDPEHALTAAELCTMLRERGAETSERTIYRDIDTLKAHGNDIRALKTPSVGYALIDRKFSLSEVRLIDDAIQAAAFITPETSGLLRDKLKGLLSQNQASSFESRVFVERAGKTNNDEISKSIDLISEAITKKLKIFLNYTRRVLTDSLETRERSRYFTVSPFAIVWSGDRFYLVCNHGKYDNLMHLRLDRIRGVRITDEEARPVSEVSEYTENFDPGDYLTKTFNMHGGEEMPLELKCKNSLIESVIDRFGEDIPLRRSGPEHFVLSGRAFISAGLAAWILQFGAEIEVIEPRSLRRTIVDRSCELHELYSGSLEMARRDRENTSK